MVNRKAVYWIPFFLLLLFGLYRSLSFPIHDFGNYYFGSFFFSKGDFSPAIYEPLEFNQKVANEGYSDLFLSYAPNPPDLSVLVRQTKFG